VSRHQSQQLGAQLLEPEGVNQIDANREHARKVSIRLRLAQQLRDRRRVPSPPPGGNGLAPGTTESEE